MTNTINMTAVFNTLDAKKAAAMETIAKYSESDRIEASRIAQIYDRCSKTSIKHFCNVARVLVTQFTPNL